MTETNIETRNCNDAELIQVIQDAAKDQAVVLFREGPRHCEFLDSVPADFVTALPELWQLRVFNQQIEVAARRMSFGESGTWRLRIIRGALSEDAVSKKSLGMLGTFRTAGEAGPDNISNVQQSYLQPGFYEDRYRQMETASYRADGCERKPGIAYPVDYQQLRSGDVVDLSVAVCSVSDGMGEIVRWCELRPRRNENSKTGDD